MPMPDEGWRQRLRPASFRGVPFKVDVSGHVLGRRTVVHEFPKRDSPSTEDMGRRARRYAIAAYIVGENYDQQRDSLIQAIEADGPGTLVHPYLGEFLVRVDAPANITERRERGRICEIEVTFVEAGDDTTPSPNTAAQAQDAGSVASAANAQQLLTAAPGAGVNNAGFGNVPTNGFLGTFGVPTSAGYGSVASVGNGSS